MSNNRRSAYVSIAVIAMVIMVTAAIILWFKPSTGKHTAKAIANALAFDNKADGAVPIVSGSDAAVKVSDRQNVTRPATGLEDLPQSLQGTEVDGDIIIDANKQLIVTEGLRRLFDYFLSALGEEDEAAISARVESYIRQHTPEPAASQAVAIFNQYIAYLKALPEIEKRYGNLQLQATKNGELDLSVVTQQKQDVAKLRQQYFAKPTIAAFFGAEDEYDDYSMEMIRIEQNTQISASQKQAARQDYISRMPDNTAKANIEQQANLHELINRTEQMKAQGATPEALYSMRRELVGAPAAARLAQVDQEDADFDQRFTQYQAQKQRLLSQQTDNAQVQTQIEQIEQQLFNDSERKRLAGYAALQQQKTANLNTP